MSFARPILAALLLLPLASLPAGAQQPATAEIESLRLEMAELRQQLALSCRVAIFDLDRILAESKMGRALEKELNEFHVARSAELQALDAELLELAQRFQAEEKLLSADAKESLAKEILGRRNALAKAIQEAGVELERRRSEGVQTIGLAVAELAKELAIERRLDLVLDRAVPLVASSRLDVTEELLERLDARS